MFGGDLTVELEKRSILKKYKVKFFLLLSIVTAAGILAGVGNGCSRSQSESANSLVEEVAPAPTSGSTTSDSDIPVIPGARTVSLVYSKQVVDQLTSCSGLAVPSEKTVAMYEQKKGSISTYGTANTVTAPMMMAVASIAGEICNDLIEQENKLGGRLFAGFNMAANALPSSAQLSDSISKLAVSCWQRNESSSERQLLLDMVSTSVGTGEMQATRKAALLVCTSMLSSLDALLN